jgi:hypothetical protein
MAINRNLRDSMVVFLSSVAASGLVFLFQLIVAKDLGLREFGSFVLLIEIMSMIILLSDAGLAVALVNLFVKAQSRSSPAGQLALEVDPDFWRSIAGHDRVTVAAWYRGGWTRGTRHDLDGCGRRVRLSVRIVGIAGARTDHDAGT